MSVNVLNNKLILLHEISFNVSSYPGCNAKLLMVDIATTAVLVPLCTNENKASVILKRKIHSQSTSKYTTQ